MTSPLVNPVSGYRTLSRFESFSSRPSIVTDVDFDAGTTLVYPMPMLPLRRLALPGACLLRRASRSRRLRFSGGVAVSRLLVGGPSCRVALPGLLGGGDARLESSHEIDALGGRDRLGRGDQLGLARRFSLDELDDAVAIRVLELVGLERSRQRCDQLLGHADFSVTHVD